MGGILQTRHLHQDSVVTLTLDDRLDSAELVDALLDDLDRLLDSLAQAVDHRGLRNAEADQSATSIGDFNVALTAGPHKAANRLRKLAQLGERRLDVRILDAHLDGIALRCETGVSDLGLAQHATDVVADLV